MHPDAQPGRIGQRVARESARADEDAGDDRRRRFEHGRSNAIFM
jgi:hypothetical protein